jgi:hypothetical protein
MSKGNLIIIGLIVKIFILLFLFASGAVFIHYGNKIKNGEISKDDKQAGEFILSFGSIGLIANAISLFMLGYNWNKIMESKKYHYIMFIIIAILFTIASNIILIIYGLKMHQNNICTDIDCPYSNCINDFEIAKYIVAFGSICIIFSFVAILFLIYEFVNKGKEAAEAATAEAATAEAEAKS